MKKILCMLLAVTMMFCLLAGCGSSDEGAESGEQVKLTLWTPPVFSVGYMDALNSLVESYEAENTNVDIEIVELNWDGIGEKLESAMMTGSTPDIYIDGAARTAKLPSTGLCVDVSDVISELDGWSESCVAIGEYEGGQYLIPLTQMPPMTISVNATLAKQYGCYDMLPEDRVSWDWDDFMAFLEACAEKSVADGVYPLGLFAGNQSSDIAYYTMLLSAGAQILNDDHTASAVNSDAAKAALAKLAEINEKGLTYPGAATLTDEDSESLFYGQKTVVDISAGSLSNIPVLAEMAEQGVIEAVPEIEAYAWPTLNGSKTVIGNWGANCMAIFENDGDEAKIAAAKDFLKYMMSDKEFSEILWQSAPNYAPARDFGQVLNLDDEQLAKEAEVNSAMAGYCDSSFGLLESYWGEIRQYFYPELQSMFLGNESADEAVVNFDAKVNEVLESNK